MKHPRSVITRVRCGKIITAFDQSIVPPGFFVATRLLGYTYRVTGNNELTHEIEATEQEFTTICALAGGIPTPERPMPKEVDFRTPLRDLMPCMEDIPDEFQHYSNPYVKLAEQWFFGGLNSKRVLFTKPGVDRQKALQHIHEIQQSFGPSHEHKMAAVAYLMSCWFDI